MKNERYSIKDLRKDFPNDVVCLEYLFNTTHSRECSCGGTYSILQGRKQFQCSKCRFQIAPMAGTIFEKTSTPLTLWFHAIFIFSNAKSGISAKEIERQIGVTYKTAWRILKLIRQSLSQGSYKLRGDVEVDETHIGGKGDGGINNEQLGIAMAKKSHVIGAVERGGEIRVQRVPNLTAGTFGTFLEEHIDSINTRIITDESNRYQNVASGIQRHTVNHSRSEFVRGDIHTNNIESFWSHVKRSIKGTHEVISKKYLQSYLDAFAFHYNMRHSDRLRFEVLIGVLVHA